MWNLVRLDADVARSGVGQDPGEQFRRGFHSFELLAGTLLGLVSRIDRPESIKRGWRSPLPRSPSNGF
jgi:hypothetical protein